MTLTCLQGQQWQKRELVSTQRTGVALAEGDKVTGLKEDHKHSIFSQSLTSTSPRYAEVHRVLADGFEARGG